MAPSVYLLMAIHGHQPVGNFGFVFDEAFKKAYEPFVAALERHPSVRVALHYSGGLLDWFEANRPEFLERLKRLAARRQVEFLSSGYYEPILPLIPEDDRAAQLQLMQDALERHFGTRPAGLWLTERVWEPELPATLASAGIRYTMVDGNQFQTVRPLLPPAAQVQDEPFWDLLGSYRTDYAGASTTLFPMSKRLRYWLPFQEPEKSIEFLRRLAPSGPIAVTYADDGEKFGLWPKTFEWVYERGWLERWFAALERESSWLATSTFSDYLDAVPSNGQVYLPCGSYEEMLEWSGGFFPNFLVKYPESHAMYRKMLAISGDLRAWKAAGERAGEAATAQIAQARRALYMAQCNDAYWHGVFGGLYLANLRRTVYGHLIQAEDLLRRVTHPPAREARDLDGDGRDEIILRGEACSAVVDPDENGTVTEISYFSRAFNLVNTLARRYEPYHDTLRQKHLAAAGQGQEPTSIHDALRVKEDGLEARLAYDDHRRSVFVDYALASMPGLQEVWRGSWGEHRLWSPGPWQVEPAASRADGPATASLSREVSGGRLRKQISLAPKDAKLRFGYEVANARVPVVALELNFGLRDERRLEPASQEGVKTLDLRDESTGFVVELALDAPATVMTFPIETVSDSEQGLERTVQGTAVVCLWPTGQAAGWSGGVECVVRNA